MNGGWQPDIDHVPYVKSYAEAMDFWASSKPWRNQTSDWDYRPLGHRRKKHMTVRRGNSGMVPRIEFRLYNTDMVTYFEDGRIDLVPYNSSVSSRFADRLMPSGLEAFYTSSCGPVLAIDDKFYLVPRKTTLVQVEGKWTISTDTPSLPFRRTIIDRKAARATLAGTNYPEFRSVLLAVRALHGIKDPRGGSGWNRRRRWSYHRDELCEGILNLLADKARWMELIKINMSSADLLTRLRDRIYNGTCNVEVTVPVIESRDEFWRWERAKG